MAATFVFFLVVSLGANHFRSKPLDIFGSPARPAQNQAESVGKKANWTKCNANDVESFKNEGEVLIVDARPGLFYKFGHIPGAISLPATSKELGSEAGKALSGVPKTRRIVVYCADEQCENAETVANLISSMGYGNIHIFSGGWAEWTDSGRQVEK